MPAHKTERTLMSDTSSTQVSDPSSPTAPVAPTPTPTAVLSYRDAFQKALPAAQALDPNDLITINIDIPTAITMAVGALPEIMALRDRVATELPKFDLKHFDDLQTYTLATGHAHAVYMGASAPPEALLQLNEKGMALRDTLYSDATALANRGIISGDRLGDFKANVGYKNLAFDLLGLSAILRQNWELISSKTAIMLTELDQADSIGEQLVNALGAREQAPAAAAEVAQQRQRIFTLFTKSYDQVRRAVSYLRWDDGDVERVSPSLYSGRATGRRKADPAAPGTSIPAPATGNTAAPGAATSPAAGSQTPAAPAAFPPVPAGLPGGSPFSVS